MEDNKNKMTKNKQIKKNKEYIYYCKKCNKTLKRNVLKSWIKSICESKGIYTRIYPVKLKYRGKVFGFPIYEMVKIKVKRKAKVIHI